MDDRATREIKIRPNEYIYKVIADLATTTGKRLAPTAIYLIQKGMLAEELITQKDIDRPAVKVSQRGGKRTGAGRKSNASKSTEIETLSI
jgi:hypothetical protein